MLIISGVLEVRAAQGCVRFNLAIEMLIISGARLLVCQAVQLLHRFNLAIEMLIISGLQADAKFRAAEARFNLAIEMLIISGLTKKNNSCAPFHVSISQSRCLSFQAGMDCGKPCCSGMRVSISQSRCLSFQVTNCRAYLLKEVRFNLAIEMLIISGLSTANEKRCLHSMFQSRNRDAYHFRIEDTRQGTWYLIEVSISQSRCLSFQGRISRTSSANPKTVSISQSRCLSFQVPNRVIAFFDSPNRFNLAIEMLIISGATRRRRRLAMKGFNLAIEMLIISGRPDEEIRLHHT